MSKNPANLPVPPSLLKTIGPSFILLGLALGSGEVILWPYLTVNYGLGLLWGALLGISFQYILNTEIMRYTLAWGESVFVGLAKWSRLFPLWFIISTVIPWSLPGFSSATADIFVTLFPQLPRQGIMIGLLILTGCLLSFGKTLYKTMEKFEKIVVIVSLLFVVVLVSWLATPADWAVGVAGLFGNGGGWWFFPRDVVVPLASFLGAFAYSGGGGNLNFAQSHYIKEKGFGMGAHSAKITSLLHADSKPQSIHGELFSNTPQNRTLWKKWWSLVVKEHGIVFWGGGVLSILLLGVLAHVLIPVGGATEGISFIYKEAAALSQVAHPFIGTMFLLSVALMLYSTQVIVLEASSRIISENISLLVNGPRAKTRLTLLFYGSLWLQILGGVFIVLSGWNEPRLLLTLAAVLNAGAMMVAFPMVYFLNTKSLPEFARPGLFRKAILTVACLFFVYFVVMTVLENI